MDKTPKHPFKKKKAVQKVYATANHNAVAAEEPATPKSKKHKQYMRQRSSVSASGRYGGLFLSWEQQYINLISEYGVTDV